MDSSRTNSSDFEIFGQISVSQTAEVEAALRRACAEVAPFSLSVSELGCFPNARKPRVLWAGLSGDVAELLRLQKRIDYELITLTGTEEGKPFVPHLTLGRVRPGARGIQTFGPMLQSATASATGDWRVESVVFFKSDLGRGGALHTPLATVRLE